MYVFTACWGEFGQFGQKSPGLKGLGICILLSEDGEKFESWALILLLLFIIIIFLMRCVWISRFEFSSIYQAVH